MTIAIVKCATDLPLASEYSCIRRGGWNDGRLGQIYDLLESILIDHGGDPDFAKRIQGMIFDVESADCDLQPKGVAA